MARIFLAILFSFIRRTLYNTCKNKYSQLQTPIIIFDKKKLFGIFLASQTQRTRHEAFLVLYWELLLLILKIVFNLKNSVWVCFSFYSVGLQQRTFAWLVKSRCVIQRYIRNPDHGVNSVWERGHILINVLRFSWRYSFDKDCVFDELKKYFACSYVFKYFVEWILVIRKISEITFIPEYH